MNVSDAIMNAERQRHFDWDEKPQWDTWICLRKGIRLRLGVM